MIMIMVIIIRIIIIIISIIFKWFIPVVCENITKNIKDIR